MRPIKIFLAALALMATAVLPAHAEDTQNPAEMAYIVCMEEKQMLRFLKVWDGTDEGMAPSIQLVNLEYGSSIACKLVYLRAIVSFDLGQEIVEKNDVWQLVRISVTYLVILPERVKVLFPKPHDYYMAVSLKRPRA